MTAPDNEFAVPLRHRHALERPRLLALLARPAALHVIRGGAGAGKTVLLSDWARSQARNATVLWLSIAESGLDSAGFWGALAPQFGGADASAAAREPLARIKHDLAHRTGKVVLALDNADRLSPDAARELVELLEVSHGLTVGLSASTHGFFESGPVRISVDTNVIDARELAFTRDEIAGVLGAASLPIDRDTVKLVHAVSGGQPLVTRASVSALIAQNHVHADDLRRAVFSTLGWNEERRIALSGGDPFFAEFIVRASVVESVPIPFAEALAQQIVAESPEFADSAVDAFALLQSAEHMGVGGWVKVGSDNVFHYTVVSRSALRSSLEDRASGSGLQSATSAETQLFAARWLIDNAAPEQGFFAAVEGENYELATDAAMHCFVSLLDKNADQLRVALGAVPPATMHAYPLLAMLLALSYSQVARLRLRAIEYFRITVKGAKAVRGQLSTPQRVVLDAGVSASLRLLGKSERAAHSARVALAGLAELSPSERDELGELVVTVAVQCGISLLYGGDPDAALETFHRAPLVESSAQGRDALAAMAATHALVGEMRETAELVVEGGKLFRTERESGTLEGALFQLARAWLALERFDLDAAERTIEALGEPADAVEHWPFFAQVQARIDLLAGKASAGSDRLISSRRRNKARADLDARGHQRLDIAASTLFLAVGSLRQAESALSQAGHPDAALLGARARIELVRDVPEEALAFLTQAAPLAATERVRAENLVIQAAAQLRTASADTGGTLERLAALLEASELLTPLALVPSEDFVALRDYARGHCSAAVMRVFDREVPAVLRRVQAIQLSEREQVVLRKLVLSGSAAEIADELFVSVNTVKSQMRSLYRKLGVGSRDEALLVAATQHLLDY